MAKDRFRSCAGAALVWLGLTAAASRLAATTEGTFPSWTRYSDGDGHFSIQFPETWRSKPIVGSANGVWFAGEIGGCRVRMQADPDAAGMSPEDALREFEAHALTEQIAEVHEEAKLLSSTTISLSGVPARLFEIEYSTTIPGQRARTREISAWLFRSGVSYLVSCSSAAGAFDRAEGDFRAVIGSFELPALVLPEALQVAPEIRPTKGIPPPTPRSQALRSADRALFLAIYPALALLHGWLARRRQRNPWPWALLGPLFFPIALVILARKRAASDLS